MRTLQLDSSWPKIICLCGSTRFQKEFQDAALRETLENKIVLSVGAMHHSDTELFAEFSEDQFKAVKSKLDALHFKKIELADEVLILNVGGYIGESTRNELNHALKLGKHIRFLEPYTEGNSNA